jgi:hypothetical protein
MARIHVRNAARILSLMGGDVSPYLTVGQAAGTMPASPRWVIPRWFGWISMGMPLRLWMGGTSADDPHRQSAGSG